MCKHNIQKQNKFHIPFLVGDTCTTENIECDGLPHSICLEGRCKCQIGYYSNAQNKICRAEHGEIAQSAEYCDLTSTLVEWNEETKICGCKPNNFNIGGLRTCIKQTQGFGTSCTQHIQCILHGNGAFCDDSEILKKCNCREYATYDEESQMCVPIVGLNEYCKETADCKLSNTVCSDRNTCVCAENYFAIDNECKPGNNAPCTNTQDCGFDEAICVDDPKEIEKKYCQCKAGLVFVNDKCLEEKNFNEDCEESEQCVPLLGPLSKCNEKKCECEGDTHYRDGRCNQKTRKFYILFYNFCE